MERRENRDDVVGRQVGRYTVVGHLATGGMAELYVVRQEAVGGFEKNLVVKVLQARYAQHPRVVRMFLDEARLAAKLNHPSIVHVYDVAEEEGSKFIAMEYIHGETLTDILKRGVEVGSFLPLEHAVHIVSQVAAGLDYAHRRHDPNGGLLRIVHRDVSPSNIMVSYEGQTKIIDFGIARVQDQIREESGMHPGKASYMSPEQVAGEAVDYRSDIFSLGIILYEITLGRRLWRGPPEEVMKRIVSDPAPPPSTIRKDYPLALEAVVMKALEKRPEDRQQSAEELRHDLEEFLAASGFRTGARQTALYLRELFPIKAALSDEGIIQPKMPTDSDSAPLPIIAGWEAEDGLLGVLPDATANGGELADPLGAAARRATAPASAPGASATPAPSRVSPTSPFPAGMTVLTQVANKPPRTTDAQGIPVVAPSGPSNAKLALIAAAITFAAITTVILIARSRRPESAVASLAPGVAVEGPADPQHQPVAEPHNPESPPPAAEKSPTIYRVPSEPTPPPARIATPARATSSNNNSNSNSNNNDRGRNRRQRRPLASSESSSRSTSASASSVDRREPAPPSSAPAAPAPVAEPPRAAPAPEPPARPAARVAPAPAAAPEAPPAVAAAASTSAPAPGFIDKKAVTTVVRVHAIEVQACFDRALMEHAELHGRLSVRATIDPSGRVLNVTPTSVMSGGGRLQTCVVAAFATWTFPPPAGGVKGTITYSFTFE